jgi:ABC-type glycerol-3-phosphate transport system substrate-binding protein
MSNQKMSRRRFLQLAGASATAGVIAACTPVVVQQTTEETSGAAGSGGAPAAETVTITFMGWGGTEEDEGVRAAIKVFQEETPGIEVTWLHTPDNYEEKFLANIAANTPPDTAFVGSAVYRTFIRDGLLLDITD